MLPIEPVLPQLRELLALRGVAVLEAPPGAGKTTRVPLALLDAPWLGGRKILMLEPRRIAARAAAQYMARSLGEQAGQTVGYRMRMDTRVGAGTRIEVVTEGVLTRMLHSDPALDDVGIVIFDEFHERSLNADLGLALTLQTRSILREDLRILVMSATVAGATVAALIGDARGPAPIVTSEGRTHPVESRYFPRRGDQQVEGAVVSAIRRAIADEEGDVLAFLPGAGEIVRVERLLDATLPAGCYVAPLHGTLDQASQDRAIAPSRPGERKVVLATTIAQTSLTIDGVRIVIDSGLTRAPRFSPRTGMTRLETVRVSRASADQRRGRAGRVAPGVVYRLWAEHDDAALVPFDRPEILEADLAPLALELAAAGIADPADLQWLDDPPPASLAHAREVLVQLDALDSAGRITPHGRAIATLGTHPRIAHMLVRSRSMGAGAQHAATALASLLGQRDIIRYDRSSGVVADVDLRLRLEVMQSLEGGAARESVHGAAVDEGAARRALQEARQWRRELCIASGSPAEYDISATGALVALAYPDRIAQRRAPAANRATARYLLRSGTGAEVFGAQSLADAAYLAVAELGGTGGEARIFSAAPLAATELEELFGDHVASEQAIMWDSAAASPVARERSRLGAIVLREGPLRDPDPDLMLAATLQGIRGDGLDVLSWSDEAIRLRQRLAFAHAVDSSWPDVSDEALLASLPEWLAPALYGATGRGAIGRVDVAAALLASLSWERRQELERLAPTHLEVPSGSRIRVDYSVAAAPVLAVRLQEVFGMRETPRIGGGRIPLTLHLLSPAHRPVQVTQDLAGFWRGAYFEVKKELKGRYPKHYWPDDPLMAEPRRGTRR